MTGGFDELRPDPNALRFLIGTELRYARDKAKVTQAQAGKAIGCTQSKINYLESGKSTQKPDEVTALLKFYRADVEQIDRLASLSARADQDTWWAQYSDVLPDSFKTFVGLEGLAESQFTYDSMHLPGQVQTAEYAMGMLEGHLRVPPFEFPQVVAARQARQRLLGPNPLKFQAVIEEHILLRTPGGPDAMRKQLEHLLELMKLPNVEIQLMPIKVSVHDGMDGDFLLLNFSEAQSIGYAEYPTGVLYIQDQSEVELYKMAAARLRRAALSTSDTAEVIKSRIAELSDTSEEHHQ